MKKMRCIVIAICLLFSFTACNSKEKLPDMYIQKAELTEQEKDIIELLGVDAVYSVYNFRVNHKIKAFQINRYELKDGKWSIIDGQSGKVFGDTKGRIALSTDDIAKGCRIAIQGENNRHFNVYTTEESKEQEHMTQETSYLIDTEEIVYEQEIPLVIQIQTSKNPVSSYDVKYFSKPEEYSKYNYEHVYAITIKFSEKTVDELSAIDKDKD